jgi:hypothetical protein
VAIRLVKSLSGSEKRFFKLQTRKHSGDKDYLHLFHLIDKSKTAIAEHIIRDLSPAFKKSDIDNSARYLVKLLTDCLVEIKISKDPWFWMLHGIMRTKVLHERSLADEGYREVHKIRSVAQQTQQHWIEYITYRHELN